MRNKILLYAGLALLAGLLVGLFAGYKVGWGIRDYEADEETLARNDELRSTNAELQELRLRLAVVNSDLVWMMKDVERRLGIGQWRPEATSAGDRP